MGIILNITEHRMSDEWGVILTQFPGAVIVTTSYPTRTSTDNDLGPPMPLSAESTCLKTFCLRDFLPDTKRKAYLKLCQANIVLLLHQH